MTVQELVAELSRLNPKSQVFIRDGHHFMREYAIGRIEEELATGCDQVDEVILVGEETPRRDT